jgi:hypothetical protein
MFWSMNENANEQWIPGGQQNARCPVHRSRQLREKFLDRCEGAWGTCAGQESRKRRVLLRCCWQFERRSRPRVIVSIRECWRFRKTRSFGSEAVWADRRL